MRIKSKNYIKIKIKKNFRSKLKLSSMNLKQRTTPRKYQKRKKHDEDKKELPKVSAHEQSDSKYKVKKNKSKPSLKNSKLAK